MKLRALGTRVRGLVHRERGAVRSGRRERTGTASMPAASGMLRHARVIALVLIAVLVLAASLVSFAESYRGLYLWAAHHGITGPWAYAWPLQVDTFVAVGELALFVGMVDQWRMRQRAGAWAVIAAGLVVSVAGNIGHVTGHSLTSHATAAVPPLAASAALAVGLSVLKRVVQNHRNGDEDTVLPVAPADAQSAALMALKATTAAGNPLSGRQLETRFGLTRAEATRLREMIVTEVKEYAVA